MNRIDEKQSQQQVLILVSNLFKLLSLYLPYRLVFLVDFFIGAIQFIKLLWIMGICLHLVPSFHLTLCLIDKECSEQYPKHKRYKSRLNHDLDIGGVKVVDIDDVKYGNNKHHIGTLAHEFLEGVLEGLVEAEVRSVRDFAIIY